MTTHRVDEIGVRHLADGVEFVARGVALPVLADLLDRAHAQHRARGHLPIPIIDNAVRALRHAAAANQLLQQVPHEEQQLDPSDARPGESLTTKQAGQALGITQRGVRQRIARGQLRATRRGRDYLIDPLDLTEAS